MWRDCPVFTNEEDACKEAGKIYDEVRLVEYGMQIIKIDRVFDENAKPVSIQVKDFSSPIENMEI